MKILWAICACICLVGPAYADKPQSLRLEKAIALALEASPTIKGAQAEYGAAIGERRQAGAFLNPVIGFEAENVSGSGAFKGTDSAELTAGVSQTFEIGGKRSARMKAADQGQIIANYGQVTARLNLIRDIKAAFAQAVTAQEEAQIASEQAKLARDMYQSVNKRVNAAAAPIMQRNKAKILMTNAELMAELAKGQKDSAFKMLTAFWHGQPIAMVDTHDFYKITKPQARTLNEQQLYESIDYKQRSASAEQANSFLDLERANAIPDPTIGVAVRDFRASNDQALVASVSLPLPVFNQNRGNIERARQLAVKADTDRQKLLLDGHITLAERSQRLSNAWLTATKTKATLLPEANEAYKQAKHGYNVGKFPYLEVLDAQRTLMETRLTYIRALRDYHIEKAEVERLVATGNVTGETR